MWRAGQIKKTKEVISSLMVQRELLILLYRVYTVNTCIYQLRTEWRPYLWVWSHAEKTRVSEKMAAEDIETDEELRELVAQTLETKGVLGKIRVCWILSEVAAFNVN